MKTPLPACVGGSKQLECAAPEVNKRLFAERTAALVAGDEPRRQHAEPGRLEERLRESEALLEECRAVLRRTEEKLRRNEVFLTQGQKLSSIAGFCWSVSSGEIRWSEELYRLFGIEAGTLVTFDLIRSRVHPEDVPLINGVMEKVRHEAGDLECVHRLLLPGGSIKHLRLVAHATRDREGRLEYVGAVQDVTQRRASEEALAKASAELVSVAKVSRIGVVVASIAHEVNQPLAGIITNATTCLSMLSTEPPNIHGARETARRALRDGSLAADVVARLRTLYGGRTVEREMLDLNAATREVLSLIVGELHRNRVVLRQDLAEGLPAVRGDRIQLQQVILNLLRNAWEAMSTIETRSRELLVRTEYLDERVCFSVRDAGIGFPPEAADVLFEAFYTTKSDGMGIGLSISRSIVEAHHGRLWAKANEGPGATFAFSLPGMSR